MDNLTEAYRILNNVINKGAYVNIEMKNLAEDCDKAFVTRLIYGVIENSIKLDYYIDKLTQKRPKPNIALILKIGLYLLTDMKRPEYATLNETVELARKLGKQGVTGFVNAVLRKWNTVELPEGDSGYALSVRYSYPRWAVDKLIKQQGIDFAKDFLQYNFTELTHIRHNGNIVTKEEFDKILLKTDTFNDAKSTNYGYYVTHNIINNLNKNYSNTYAVQSLGSMLVCMSADKKKGGLILDVCAAPGGKSIYLAEVLQTRVTACDIYPHRVELITAYAKKMKADVEAVLCDGTKYREDFNDKFDLVLCDVPCSGYGVINMRPDIKLNREENDIQGLNKLQDAILRNSARYVKKGGELIYSTCTVFEEENVGIVIKFLTDNKDFVIEEINLPCMPSRPVTRLPGSIQYYPHADNINGYFIAKLRKVQD